MIAIDPVAVPAATSRGMATLAPASETVSLFAEAAMSLNRPREAADALLSLGPDRGFTHGWWLYWDDLAAALHQLGDHCRELSEALEAARRFPDNPQVLATHVRALAALGRSRDLAPLLAASMNLVPAQGWTPADVMLLAALELRAHGHAGAGDTALARTSDWLAARSPAEAESPAHRYRVAVVSYVAGRLEVARRQLEQLAAAANSKQGDPVGLQWAAGTLGDGPDPLSYVGYLGAIAAREGDRGGACAPSARSRAWSSGISSVGRRCGGRASTRSWASAKAAVLLLRQALAQGYPHLHSLHTDLAFESLRDYPPFQEVLRPKG